MCVPSKYHVTFINILSLPCETATNTMTAARMRYNQSVFDDQLDLRPLIPMHVQHWILEHEDDLFAIYDDTRSRLNHTPWIMNRATFSSFCACMARLSSIDSPMTMRGQSGGRRLPHDFMNSQRSGRADEYVRQHEPSMLVSRVSARRQGGFGSDSDSDS